MSKGYDSINTVTEVKEFLWKDGKALNYNPAKAPNSQDLPDIVKLTFGVNMISKEEMLKRSNVVGKKPLFYNVDEVEAIDIDTRTDFDFAKFVYKNKIANA